MLFESTKSVGIFEYGLLNGSFWLKVFYHSYYNKALFLNDEEASFIISNDKYSILSNISSEYLIEDKYEFLLIYPETDRDVYFHWRQKLNPIDDNEQSGVYTATDFEPIYKNVDNEYSWGGLVKTTDFPGRQIQSFINGNPGIGEWHFAIGMNQNAETSWKEDGIPNYIYRQACKLVSLWIKIPQGISKFVSIDCSEKNNIKIPPSLFSIFISI